jgi:hypothetical protein
LVSGSPIFAIPLEHKPEGISLKRSLRRPILNCVTLATGLCRFPVVMGNINLSKNRIQKPLALFYQLKQKGHFLIH